MNDKLYVSRVSIKNMKDVDVSQASSLCLQMHEVLTTAAFISSFSWKSETKACLEEAGVFPSILMQPTFFFCNYFWKSDEKLRGFTKLFWKLNALL